MISTMEPLDKTTHPETVAEEILDMKRRMEKLRCLPESAIKALFKSSDCDNVVRNFKYGERALQMGFISKKQLREIMRNAWEDRANPRLKVLAYLTKEQHKQVLKSTSQEHGSVMVLDRYLLISLYAQGGGGKIYLATDTHTGGKVVVKCLPYHHDSDQEKHLQRESKIQASLRHPCINEVVDYGSENGRWFSVFTYISGDNLEKLLMQGNLAWPLLFLLTIMLRIIEAIAYLHSQEIVHRDIKPANIMVDDNGMPYLVDFGLAKGRNFATVTTEGFVVGTPLYMAPERFCSDYTDLRSDIWSLGVTLYALITGEILFSGANMSEVAASIRNFRYKPIRSRVKAFPPALDYLLARCMAKNPEHRYATMEAVAQDLDLILRKNSNNNLTIPLHLDKKRSWLRRLFF